MYTELTHNYNKEFDTYIIAFCPDTDSYFITNKRGFYYEYQGEFISESTAIDFFTRHINIFIDIRNELLKNMGQRAKDSIYLENTNITYNKED